MLRTYWVELSQFFLWLLIQRLELRVIVASNGWLGLERGNERKMLPLLLIRRDARTLSKMRPLENLL